MADDENAVDDGDPAVGGVENGMHWPRSAGEADFDDRIHREFNFSEFLTLSNRLLMKEMTPP
ncbi:UNVERIFIED_CONTAM: hypothetical protein Slati_3487200 [Sesamum latifolium]|uniref:Uncharacterized protein n=1 Tax=Sesamum latifolium TaxID=2727402 RepID=A0AAW2UIW9_9LAMI